jgi:P27 family predicted phage terminase small subunit
MRGRPRKPTGLKILEGNRGRRKIVPEPEPINGAPEMPEGMPEEAQKIWRQLVGELDRLGILTQIDGLSLEAACRGAAEGRWADGQREALQRQVDTGEEKVDQSLVFRITMLNSLSKKGWQQWKSFGVEMGLTPASRSKLCVKPSEKAMDPLEAALCG